MNKFVKVFLVLFIGVLFSAPVLSYQADLFAGQDILVGDVTVTVVNGEVIVTYTIDDPTYWCIQHVHVDIQDSPEAFPQTKKGNPKNGQFAVNEAVDCESSYTVNLGDEPDNEYYIAAHAEIDNTPTCQWEGVLYGTELATGEIWEIDPVNCLASSIIDTGLNGSNVNYPNGLAYDPITDSLYFAVPNESSGSDIYSWDFVSPAAQLVPGSPVTGLSAGATYWMSKYWFVPNESDELFTFDGVEDFWCDLDGAGASTSFRFGDSAVAPGTSTLYASTNNPRSFWSIDLNGCQSGSTIQVLCTDSIEDCADSQQMSYGSNGVLYGHSTGGGQFFEIDTSTGLNGSPVCETFNEDQETLHFTDLASGPQCTADREETAWADGNDFSGNNWATYMGPIDPYVECTFTDTAAPNYEWTWTLFVKWDGTILAGSYVTGLPTSWEPGTIDVDGTFDPAGSVAMSAYNPTDPDGCPVSSVIDVSATCTGSEGSCTGNYQGFEGDGDSCYPARNWAVADIGVCELGNPSN